MRKFYKGSFFRYSLVLLLLSLALLSCGQDKSLVQQLEELGFSDISVLESDSIYKESYQLFLEQPLDHTQSNGETFKQKIYLGHIAYAKPMVLVTEGYSMWSPKATELSKLLNTNQITVEHRYFDTSRPDSLQWEYLTAEQAAADHHRVVKLLKKIYSGKWINTGISKGGQTAIFHRTLYPDDVDVSVPYVAPVNYEREDGRIHRFLHSVGTKNCRAKIVTFQKLLFENKSDLIPLLEDYANKNNYTFSMGLEQVLELNILEYSFAFWQWGNATCEEIPGKNTSVKEMFDHLVKVSSFSFFEDKGINNSRPFFYQALTQIGMYSYEIAPFNSYLNDTADMTFDFTLPGGVKGEFDPAFMQKVKKFLQNDAQQMLFIYGELDTWSATSAEVEDNPDVLKMVLKGGHHGTRIRHFSEEDKEKIMSTLKKWLEME